jgi:hypothetical protein
MPVGRGDRGVSLRHFLLLEALQSYGFNPAPYWLQTPLVTVYLKYEIVTENYLVRNVETSVPVDSLACVRLNAGVVSR